jgi:tubulin monoglycylase TTLL3/8
MLNKNQIANHFHNNIEITKKSGLSKNIKNLIFKNVDIDNFYPRCFELSERHEMDDFLEDFKTNKAISILIRFFKEYSKIKENNINGTNISCAPNIKNPITEDKLKAAIEICERKLMFFEVEPTTSKQFYEKHNIDNYIKSLLNQNGLKLITDREWSIISEEDNRTYTKEIQKLEKINKTVVHSKNFNRSKSLLTQTKISNIFSSSEEKSTANQTPNKKENVTAPVSLEKYLPIVNSLLQRLRKIFPQYSMNGEKNIWILKPSGLSRGRGITCINSLNEILNFIKTNSNQYIGQKYIENPLIIKGRKFDIRQWVLVTDLDPLTIWLYDTPYLRFGAEDYKPDDFSNLYSHLTNNSVVKYSKNFENSAIIGNMWEIKNFSEYLILKYGQNVWKELQEKIKKIVISSMESVKKVIKSRKNSFELYGYDIMIDEQLNAWLIEVNSSPAMDYSTVSIP